MFRGLRPSGVFCASVLYACLLIGVVGFGPPSVVHAQPRASSDAQTLFRRGLEHSKAGRWGEAVDAFERSRALVERPSVLQNLAVALARVGRYAAALAEIDRYMELTESEPRSAIRQELEQLRSDIEGKVAVLRMRVTPGGAELHVDGIMVPRSDDGAYALRLDPGRHAVRVAAEGHVERSFQVVTSAGASLNEDVSLDPVQTPVETLPRATGPTGPVATPDVAPLSPRPLRMRRYGYALLGVGLAAAVPAVWLHSLNYKERDGCVPDSPCDSRYERRQLYGNFFSFSAGALVGTAAVLLVTGTIQSKRQTQLTFGTSSLGLRMQF